MPTYEYRCTRCRHMFDLYQAVGEAAPSCPECGAPTQKVFASVGLIFKGSGFHTTDYPKAAAGNDGDAKRSDDGSKESPSASGPGASTSPSTSPGTSSDSSTAAKS